MTRIIDGHMTSQRLCEPCALPVLQVIEQQEAACGTGQLPPELVYEQLASKNPPFSIDAFRFVARAVQAAISARTARNRQHVSGREVADAFRVLALNEFGTSALPTLHGWGFRSTDDIGTIVFLMINFGILGGRPEDSPADFHAVYEFASAFPTVA